MRWQLGMFDWDGSLYNSLDGAYGAAVEIFRVFAPDIAPPSLEEYRDKITSDFSEFYYAHGIERAVTGDDMNRVRSVYMKRQELAGCLNAGAHDLLACCRGLKIPMAIVSANPETDERFREILRELNILGNFGSISLRAWPKDEVLLETLDRFGAQAERSFYFDDTFDGIASAKRWGIRTIGYTGGYNSPRRIAEAVPNFIAHSLHQAAEIIATVNRE